MNANDDDDDDDDASVEAILGTRGTLSPKAPDDEQKERDKARQRESLEEQRSLLVKEWKRVQKRRAELEKSKVKDDPFLRQSILDNENAIRTRLAAVAEALKLLRGSSGGSVPPPEPSEV